MFVLTVNDQLGFVASFSSDMRSLVLEGSLILLLRFLLTMFIQSPHSNFLLTFVIHVGVSISSCITGKSDSDEDEDRLFSQLDDIYQVRPSWLLIIIMLSYQEEQ